MYMLSCLFICLLFVCLVKQFAMCMDVVTGFFLLVSSGCLTGSWSVWSHAVTPHSTIYHLVFVI